MTETATATGASVRISSGDLCWAELDPVVGHEQAGRRPVLVLSGAEYNARSRLALVVPVTTRGPKRAGGLGNVLWVELEGATGLSRQSWAKPGQIRTVSVLRLGAPVGVASEAVVQACVGSLVTLCREMSGRGKFVP